jgi:endonuclease-3
MATMKSTQKAAQRIGKELPPPQALSAAARRAAIEGIPVKKARAIAAKEPASPKAQATKTKDPLAPQRIAAILDALRKAFLTSSGH